MARRHRQLHLPVKAIREGAQERVNTACGDYPSEACQSVTAHIAARGQVRERPSGDRLAGEACDLVHLDSHGMPIIVRGRRRHDRHLVGRATTAGARTLATKVGVIELNHALQGLLAVRIAWSSSACSWISHAVRSLVARSRLSARDDRPVLSWLMR